MLWSITTTRSLKVLWLQDGSPATEAGLAPDDVIEAVDGRPVAETPPPTLREKFQQPGKTYRLTVRRGGTRLEVTLTTRRLI